MKLRSLLLAATLGAASIMTNAQTKQTMENGRFTTEQNEVMKVITEMTEAFQKKDLKRILATYEPNAVIVFEPGNPVSGTEEISEAFKGSFAFDPVFEYSGHEVFINGDLALHFAPWIMSGKTPEGDAISQSGLSVAVLRKQADGKWLMVFDNPYGQHLLDER